MSYYYYGNQQGSSQPQHQQQLAILQQSGYFSNHVPMSQKPVFANSHSVLNLKQQQNFNNNSKLVRLEPLTPQHTKNSHKTRSSSHSNQQARQTNLTKNNHKNNRLVSGKDHSRPLTKPLTQLEPKFQTLLKKSLFFFK